MNEVLIDTNVLVYAVDEDSNYFIRAQSVFYDDRFRRYVTYKNISEFLAVITRIPEKAIPMKEALAVVQDFKALATVLYPSQRSSSIFENLLAKYQPRGLRIHDFEIISIGLAHGITSIATFDTKGFGNIAEIVIESF